MKMEVLNLAAFDDHICVYCRRKINGLNNYIEHLKTCEPFDSFDGKSVPRLPIIRTPSRESLQSEVNFESLTGSRCSSPDSYMQRIYDDMERYEKEVLGCDSVVEGSCREMSNSDNVHEKNGGKDFMSTRLPATTVPTVMEAEGSGVDKETVERFLGELKKFPIVSMGSNSYNSVQTVANSACCVTGKSNQNMLNESGVSLSSTFSEQVGLYPEGSMVSKSDNNVSKESGFSLSSPDEVRERNTKEKKSKKLPTTTQKTLGKRSSSGKLQNCYGCGLDGKNNVEYGCRQAVNKRSVNKNSASSDVIGTGFLENKSEPMQKIPVLAKDSKLCSTQSNDSGFTMATHEGVMVYKVWGITSELLSKNFKECMFRVFSSLTSNDKSKVLSEVDKMCSTYTSRGGLIQIKIIQALNKMNVLIKRVEDSDVELGDEMMDPEDFRREERNDSNVSATGDKESLPKKMPNSLDFAAEMASKSSVGCQVMGAGDSTHVTQEGIIKKVTETISSALSPNMSTQNWSHTPGKSAIKKGNDEAFEGVQKSSESGKLLDTGDHRLKTSEDTLAGSSINKAIVETEDIPNTSTVSQKNNKQKKETTVVGGKSGDACELKNSQHHLTSPRKVGAQSKSKMVCIPWHSLSDNVFFSSLEDVGLQVEVGPNDSSSSITEDLLIEELCSQLIPLQLQPRERASVRKMSWATRKRRSGRGRGRGGWRRVREMHDHSSAELLQDDNKNRLKKLGRPSRGRGRNRVGSRKTLCSSKVAEGEGNTDSVKIDGFIMGLQRYNLRSKPIEGCSSVIKETLKDALTNQECIDSGVELSTTRPLDDVEKVRTPSRRGFCKRGRRSNVMKLMPLVEEKVCGREDGQITDILKETSLGPNESIDRHITRSETTAVMHPKETRLDPNKREKNSISILKETAQSKCVEGHLGTDLKDITENKDLESVSEVRGLIDFDNENVPLQKKGILRRHSGGITKNVHTNSTKKRKKVRFIFNRRKMQLRRVSRVALWRHCNGSPMPFSRFSQSRYSLRNMVFTQVDPRALFNSDSEGSDEDDNLEQKTSSPPTRKLNKNRETELDPVPSSCNSNPGRQHKLRRNPIKRRRKQSETDEVRGSEPDPCNEVGDKDHRETTATQNDVQSASSSSSEGNVNLESVGHDSLPTARKDKSSLCDEADKESLENPVILECSDHSQDNIRRVRQSTLNRLKCAEVDQVPTVECRQEESVSSGCTIKTVKLNQDDKGSLQLLKTLKPFCIDLGFRCDTKEFLSKMRNENSTTSINLNLCNRSRTSLNHGENRDTSARRRTTSECHTLEEHERKRRKIVCSDTPYQRISKETEPVLFPDTPVKEGVNIPKLTNCNFKDKSNISHQKIRMEEMPVLLPELPGLQEKNSTKISNGIVIKDSKSPRRKVNVKDETLEIKRKPVQISSRLIEDDEIQIVLEFVKDRVQKMQAHIDRLKGWRVAESLDDPEELMAESLAKPIKCKLSSVDEPSVAHRDGKTETLTDENVIASLCSASSEMTSRMTVSIDDEKQELDNGVDNADLVESLDSRELVSENGLSNVLITDIRSGAELTEEEGNIPIPVDDDVQCISKVLASPPCVDKLSVSGGANQAVLDQAAGCKSSESLPDVVVVSHTNCSSVEKETEISYVHKKYGYSKNRNVPVKVDSPQCSQSFDESVQVEKVIPLITLLDETREAQRAKVPQNQISQGSQLRTFGINSNVIETGSQLMSCCNQHGMEQRNIFVLNPSGDLNGSVMYNKIIPLNPSKASLSPVVQHGQLDLAAPSNCQRSENHSDAIARNRIYDRPDFHVDIPNDLSDGNWEVYLSVTTTLPPNIPSRLQSISGFVQGELQNTMALQFKDKSQFIEFLKLQSLGHDKVPNHDESLAGTVNNKTSSCFVSLAKHQLIKLGEIVSSSLHKVKEEINVLAKSLGMKMLLTQPGRYQLGKIILYNFEERRPESNTIRVDYCKIGQRRQE